MCCGEFQKKKKKKRGRTSVEDQQSNTSLGSLMGDAHMSRCSMREELRSRRQVGSQRELGVSEHSRENSAKRMLCQLSYNHTQLGALGVCTHHRQDFLKIPTHSLDY